MKQKQLVPGGYKLDHPEHSTFAIFMLQEMDNQTSVYKEYLEKLQPSLETFPIYYTDMEKEFLEGTAFLELIETKMESMQKDYNSIVKDIPEIGEKFSFD